MSQKKCLVTGASGFIGTKLLNLLSSLPYEICLLSRAEIKGYKTFICDYGVDPIPNDAFSNIDTIFHLAGYAHDNSDDIELQHIHKKINYEFTIDLVNLAIQNNVKNFIFISSVKAAENRSKKCANEKASNKPSGSYGIAKREAEITLLELTQKINMHVSIIRPPLVYGPGVKGNLGNMYMKICNGIFLPLQKTKNIKSMVHVDDLVRAIVFVSEEKKANNEIYIVTDNKKYSTDQIYKIIVTACGKEVPKWFVPNKLFQLVGFFIPSVRRKVEKLFSNECYSSKKIQDLGFRSKKSLKDINETSF